MSNMSKMEVETMLRDFLYKSSSSNIKERKEAFETITDHLKTIGDSITEDHVQNICEIIRLIIFSNRERSSQLLAKNLIVTLLKTSPKYAIKHLTNVLKKFTEHNVKYLTSQSACHVGLEILYWSSLIYTIGSKSDQDTLKLYFKEIIQIQALLITNIASIGIQKLIDKATHILNNSWNEINNSEQQYLEKLKDLEPSQQTIVLASFISKRLSSINQIEALDNYLGSFVETFIKLFINTKVKPSSNIIIATYPLLRRITQELFKNTLLLALQKAMLRNPEIILECVGVVIAGVEIDLSFCAIDLGNSFITNLHSKDDQARQNAVDCCKALASHVSDPKILEELVMKTFAVFHGSEGKLTVIDQKLSVLQGAGNFSYNSVAENNLNAMILRVAEFFIKALHEEVHERTLCYALDMFALWGRKLTNQVPKNIVDAFQKGMNLKTSTPIVRIAYLKCILAWFDRENNMKQILVLLPILLKAVERTISQSTQCIALTEGLLAAYIILKLEPEQELRNNEFNTIMNAILDMDKQIFVSEKFMSMIDENDLLYVVLFSNEILNNYKNKLKGDSAPLLRTILRASTHRNSKIRQNCLAELKRIVQKDHDLAINLLKELQIWLSSVKNRNSSTTDAQDVELSSHALSDCITCICSFEGSKTNELLLEAFLPCHYSTISILIPDLWLKICKYLKCDPKVLITQNYTTLKKILIENFIANDTNECALSTLIYLNSKLILPDLVDKVSKNLNNPQLLNITKDEYFTFLTPEGELYDKSVIPGEDGQNTINLKRESKVYSYKEQLEELQLRRELEEKKKKDGKFKQPQYTQKQLEAIKNQKMKEAEIKQRLTELHNTILNTIAMIRAGIKGNPTQLSLHFKNLLPAILTGLKSPLSAPDCSKLFVNLRLAAISSKDDTSDKTLTEAVAYVTLRLSQPQCDIDPNWEIENLNKAMVRVIGLIHQKVLNNSHFSYPGFCYIFYLLQHCLTSNYAKNHNEVIHDCLQIISHHIKIRKYGEELYHPRYLPIKQLFELLLDVISSTNGPVQSQTVACLLDVATRISDEVDETAKIDEIDVLLSALRSPLVVVRDAALRSLIIIKDSLLQYKDNLEFVSKLKIRVWVIKFDDSEDIRNLGDKFWDLMELKDFDSTLTHELLLDIEHPVESVQSAASRALAVVLQNDQSQVRDTIDQLLKLYNQRLQMIPAKLDEFGREIEKPIDTWFPRRGIAFAFTELAPLITPDLIGDLLQFFVSTSLGDRNLEVRKEMLNAALKIVDLHGKETVSTLWPIFDNFMEKSSKSAHFDAVKQAVVVLMGSLARHLEKDDPRIKPIFLRLIQALSTPSQTVQEAVGNCLPPLVPFIKDDAPGYINKLLHQLLKGDKYGERKGAAYGLAGMVKGLGILTLKQHDIMTKLIDAIQDKKNYKHREGALFAFEMLFHMLGKLFEPYIIHVLPHLLQCFGDTSQYVRTAADDTAKMVMSKLSGHGVKLVLPSLLDALEQDSWRTKTGSVELLGAMAYCAPKQLSSCLPSIVPKLIEVLSDSHIKVQEAGAAALKVIGSVIRNPEIQAIVPVLLKALQDPSNKTSVCLQTLLDTQFVHFIDAPSLALIMPVVQRAFMDRSTETRKMAAQIIGNMYSLTDQKDLLPYLPTIIPGLKSSLLDPVPEVRSVSARALGAMVRGMGESSFEDLLPWLMQTLTSETSSVDRSGAAQGLSEVVGGLGVEKLHKLMPDIIATSERTDIAPHVKDGYIMMFIYMPVVFTTEFTPYIGQIINPILKALADENEYVRDTALKAGQRIVNLYADSAILLLLPQLEAGLFDANWRIRYSSVQLLGDLLYRISGVTGKMSTETASEDDNFGTEQSHQAIIKSLGAERRNRVLAGLYMGRSDVALMVRQAALHVWKVVVTNTPRTLREILPTLFGLLLGCLASESYDKRQVAARTLGDLVRKLGERVLPEIIPILERGLQSDQADQRQGVCIGLSEIMTSTSKDMVLTFVNSLVPTVRKALCDPLPEVRQAAAKTFDSLHSTVGARALDDILPTLLNQLNDEDPNVVEWTLDGLRQVMAIKSRVVLPYLVPQLTAPPPNTKALSILASVAGEALNKYLPRILPALQTALATSRGTSEEVQQLEYCQAVVLSVVDEVGIRTVIDILLENTRNENPEQRRAAASLLCGFCANSRAQYTTYVPQLLRGLIHLCSDVDKDVLQMSWEALNAVTKTLEPKQQASYVSDVRQAVRYAMSDVKDSDLLPGFCLPKGIVPILPIFREAILNGDGDEKETAAQGLGEVIKVTSPQALQPSVVAITGPLIRILGDRFNANVKTAVLETLAILLSKVGIMLKQFLPQLQTTFVKALNDPNRPVRLKSAAALSHLIVIHQRTDPLFLELHNTIKNTDDSAIRETTLHALRGIITPAGDKMSDPVKKQIHVTLISLLSHPEDVTRTSAAGCLGALCRWLSSEQLEETLMQHLFGEDTQIDWTLKQGRGAALSVALKEAPEVIWQEQYKPPLTQTILRQLSSDKVIITQIGVRCCGYLFQHLMLNDQNIPNTLLVPFTRTMNNNSNEVKQLLARVSIHLAKTVPQEKMSSELLRLLLPTLVNGTKEKNGYVKANSELALIAVLRLREGDSMQQRCLDILDVGAKESLSDVVTRVLKKILPQTEAKEEELDDTLLT